MKTVIEMAREAGFEAKRGWGLRDFAPEDIFAASVNITREIERFAALVRADERGAVEELLKEYDMVNSTFAKDFRARSNT